MSESIKEIIVEHEFDKNKIYIPENNAKPAADIMKALLAEAIENVLSKNNLEALAMSRLANLDSIGNLVKENGVLCAAIIDMAEKMQIAIKEQTVIDGSPVIRSLAVSQGMQLSNNNIAYIAALCGSEYNKLKAQHIQQTKDLATRDENIVQLRKTAVEINTEFSRIKRKESPSFTDTPFFIYNAAQQLYISFDKDEKKFITTTSIGKAKRYSDAAAAAVSLLKMLERDRIEDIKLYRILRLRTSDESNELGAQTIESLNQYRK